MSEKDLKAMYRTRTTGQFPDTFTVLDNVYEKVEDLRYGTNPHQAAAFYRPVTSAGVASGPNTAILGTPARCEYPPLIVCWRA